MAGEAMSSAAPQEMQVVERMTTTIGECAFVGSHAIVYPGVTVGHHAVVKAGSVVTKDVPAYVIVAGTPAIAVGWRERDEHGVWVAKYLPKDVIDYYAPNDAALRECIARELTSGELA